MDVIGGMIMTLVRLFTVKAEKIGEISYSALKPIQEFIPCLLWMNGTTYDLWYPDIGGMVATAAEGTSRATWGDPSAPPPPKMSSELSPKRGPFWKEMSSEPTIYSWGYVSFSGVYFSLFHDSRFASENHDQLQIARWTLFPRAGGKNWGLFGRVFLYRWMCGRCWWFVHMRCMRVTCFPGKLM